ncbi:MAG: carboxypeptidase regulatory-like domain-containing protein [Acidobacteriota bacterium]
MSRVCRLFTLSLALLFACSTGYADDLFAALHGTVTDGSGAVISGATVTVRNASTGIASVRTTDRGGYFIFPQLAAVGPYTVTVSADGFQAFTMAGLILNVNSNRQVDAVLGVAATSQTIEVTAGALQVETANTQLQQMVTASQLAALPLMGRDAAGLQKLEPGVVESSDRFGTFASNGSQTAQNSYMVDGIDINDPMLQREGMHVNPDALAEENIVTSTMNAQFARNSGAVVNQILKSGTNQFHGSGFEFYRDTFLNNGDYFAQTRPAFHQNLYGGTLGGPLMREKLFFFAAYQGMRNRTAQTTIQTTMSGDQLAGNFTADPNYGSGLLNSAGLSTNPLPFSIAGCAAGTPWASCFASGAVTIAPAQWNSIAANLVRDYVLPANRTVNGVAYSNFNALNTNAQDQGIVRLDYTPGQRDSLWLSSIFESSPGTMTLAFGGGSFPGFGSLQANHFKLFSTSWTHMFTADMLNELRGSYYRNPFGSLSPAQVVTPASAGFAITPQDPQSGLPYLTIGSYFDLGFSFQGPQPRLSTNMNFADNLSWVRGSHAWRFGAQFEQFRVRNPFDVYNNGFYAFEGGGPYSSGDPLIDFLMGIPDVYYQSNNGFINAVASEWFAYAQDNWKLAPDLTLNYGLAWDVEKPYENKQFGGLGVTCWQNSSAASSVFPGAPPGLMWPGDKGCNAAGSPTPRYDHVAPRVGFAWSPARGPELLIGQAGAHNFSLRAGFGVYYNRDQEEQSLQNLQDPPFMYMSQGVMAMGGSPSLANPFADVAGHGAIANPFPYAHPKAGAPIQWLNYLPLQLAAFDSNYSVPYAYNFNLNVQRALGPSRVVQIGYVGSLGRRLATWYEGDAITPAGHAACLADPMCVANRSSIHLLFPQYTAQPATVPGNPFGLPFGTPYYISVGEQNTGGISNYNALEASLIQAPTRGLQFTLAYTYGHALDDGSGYENAVGRQGRVRNFVPGFEWLNYGSSDFDARHRVSASYVYNLPTSSAIRAHAVLRSAMQGWQIAGVTVLQSGFPLEIYAGTPRSMWCDKYSYFGCPDVPQMANFRLSGANIRHNPQYFDVSQFSAEPLGTFGNTPRNFFHGPGFNYTNLQVSRTFFGGGERRPAVQIRLEAFNAFNHANFANPSGNFSSPSFGQITSVVHSADPNGDPSPGRAVQLATRIAF